jgi:hypothetical protein
MNTKLNIKVLVIDIGGTFVKLLATGETKPREFPSNSSLTPEQLVTGVLKAAQAVQHRHRLGGL